MLAVGLLYRLVPLLPRESLVALGRGLGRLGAVFLRHDRKVALANLDLAYGESLSPREKRRIVRKAFESFGQAALEIFWARRFTPETLAKIVETPKEEVDFIHGLCARGKGLLAVASHMGSWEAMNTHAALLGFPLSTLTRKLRNAALNDLVNANRTHHGSDVILHDDAARGIFKALRRKRCVAIPLDQNTRPDRGGVYVDFFGKPVAASRAVAMFALRTGAPVVLSSCFPLRGGRYRIVWGPEIPIPPEDHPDRERELTQRCLSAIEGKVREHPDAWLWMYRRWKYRPTEDKTGFPYYSKHVPEPAVHVEAPA